MNYLPLPSLVGSPIKWEITVVSILFGVGRIKWLPTGEGLRIGDWHMVRGKQQQSSYYY